MDKLTTYGATRAKLLANRYAPCSAVHHDAGWKRVDDPAGILLCSPDERDRQCVAFVVTVQDKELRAEVIAVLAKFGLAGAPCRIASDGSIAYLLRWDGHDLALTRESARVAPGELPAVVLAGVEDISSNHYAKNFLPDTLRVDGEWKGGSPLSMPRSKLPALDNGSAETVWAEVSRIVDKHSEVAHSTQGKRFVGTDPEPSGHYKPMHFLAPVYETDETPPPAPAQRGWWDSFTNSWIPNR